MISTIETNSQTLGVERVLFNGAPMLVCETSEDLVLASTRKVIAQAELLFNTYYIKPVQILLIPNNLSKKALEHIKQTKDLAKRTIVQVSSKEFKKNLITVLDLKELSILQSAISNLDAELFTVMKQAIKNLLVDETLKRFIIDHEPHLNKFEGNYDRLIEQSRIILGALFNVTNMMYENKQIPEKMNRDFEIFVQRSLRTQFHTYQMQLSNHNLYIQQEAVDLFVLKTHSINEIKIDQRIRSSYECSQKELLSVILKDNAELFSNNITLLKEKIQKFNPTEKVLFEIISSGLEMLYLKNHSTIQKVITILKTVEVFDTCPLEQRQTLASPFLMKLMIQAAEQYASYCDQMSIGDSLSMMWDEMRLDNIFKANYV